MEAGGWVRLWCANSPRALPKEMRGLSDNGYIRDGVLLFVEDKGDGDKLSQRQEWFREMIRKSAPLNAAYVVAESLVDYEIIVSIRKVE